jgi:hypothetical protein
LHDATGFCAAVICPKFYFVVKSLRFVDLVEPKGFFSSGGNFLQYGEPSTRAAILQPRFFFPQDARNRHFDMRRIAWALNDIKRTFSQSFEVKFPVARASRDNDPKSFAP